MKTVMIVHRWSDGDPRCNKIIRTLLDESIKVIFIGIRTKESPVDETLNVYGEKYIRISFFQDSNSRKDVVFNLIPFIIFVLKNIAKFKPDIVHCVNEEIGLIACLLKKYFFKYMVLDLFDSLCLRIRTNNVVIKTMISYLCYFAYKSASDIIVTDEERKNYCPLFIGVKVV